MVSKAFMVGHIALALAALMLIWAIVDRGLPDAMIFGLLVYLVIGFGVALFVGAQIAILTKRGTITQQRHLSRLGCAVLITWFVAVILDALYRVV